MRSANRVPGCWLMLLMLAGCASAEVVSRQYYEGSQLPRPARIIVYDFAATPEGVPPDSPYAALATVPSTPQTPEEIETGKALGAEVAKDLVTDLQGVGLPVVRAAGQPPPQLNDIVIRGYFLSVDTGSVAERLILGFGAGAAEAKTVVEAYHMTPQGLVRLAGGEVSSGESKMPGMIVPIAVTAVTANPIGLIVGGVVKVSGEVTGRTTIEGAGKRTADEIAEQLKAAAQRQGWI